MSFIYGGLNFFSMFVNFEVNDLLKVRHWTGDKGRHGTWRSSCHASSFCYFIILAFLV